jgi:hypothetical protein
MFFISLLFFVPIMRANQIGVASSRNSQAYGGASNAVAESPPTVRISPESITVLQVDDNFTVYVTVDDVVAVVAAQVQLTYDPRVLNVTEVAEGPFLESAGPTAVAQLYAEENLTSLPAKGEVYYASAIVGAEALMGASGSGVLLNVTFRVVSEGSTVLHLLSYNEGTGRSGTYFIHLNSDSSLVEVIPNLEDGHYGSLLAYSLSASTFKSDVSVTSNITLSDGNMTMIQRANAVSSRSWLLVNGTYYVQALIVQNGFVYGSEQIQVNLTHNMELAIDFLFGNLTISCLDAESRPMKNCTLVYSLGAQEQTRYSDSLGSDTLEAYYGNWTIKAYWMGVLVGKANANVNQSEVGLSLQCNVGDFTVVATDQYGYSVEVNVTLRSDAYNLTLQGYIYKPFENITFTQIPLVQYNLTIRNGFGTDTYIISSGQTRQIQIETLPASQKLVYVAIGAICGIVTGSLAVWMFARRRRKSTVE